MRFFWCSGMVSQNKKRGRHVHVNYTPSTAFFPLYFYFRFKFFTNRLARRGQLKPVLRSRFGQGADPWANTQGSRPEGWMRT